MTAYFGDVTAGVITALRSLGVPVSSKVPMTRPTRFITVVRTGGPRRNQVTDEAQITVDSWAETSAAAVELAEQARYTLHQASGTTVAGVQIYTVAELSGPAAMPDESGQDRYRQNFLVPTRGLNPSTESR